MRITSPSHEELISGTSRIASADACGSNTRQQQNRSLRHEGLRRRGRGRDARLAALSQKPVSHPASDETALPTLHEGTAHLDDEVVHRDLHVAGGVELRARGHERVHPAVDGEVVMRHLGTRPPRRLTPKNTDQTFCQRSKRLEPSR